MPPRRKKAWLYSPLSGITMKVYSDCEGMQVYSGNFLTGADVDRYGKELVSRSGICFEPQRYPDSINQPAFPDPILRPGRNLSPVYPLPVWHRRIKNRAPKQKLRRSAFYFSLRPPCYGNGIFPVFGNGHALRLLKQPVEGVGGWKSPPGMRSLPPADRCRTGSSWRS